LAAEDQVQAEDQVKLWSHVVATKAPTDPSDIEADEQARALIGMSVKDHLLCKIDKCTTAAAAWDTLSTIYAAESAARQHMIRLDLSTIKKGPVEAISKYVARAEGYMGQLAAAGSRAG
jgi:hypothetical protein